MAQMSRAQLVKACILMVGVADCLGIYLAHSQLSRPVVTTPEDDAFALAASANPDTATDRSFDDFTKTSASAVSTPPAVSAPIAAAPAAPTPQQIAQTELPLPDYGIGGRVRSDLPAMGRAGSARGAVALRETSRVPARSVHTDLPLARADLTAAAERHSAAKVSVASHRVPHTAFRRSPQTLSHLTPSARPDAGDQAFSDAFAIGLDPPASAELAAAPAQGELALEQPSPAAPAASVAPAGVDLPQADAAASNGSAATAVSKTPSAQAGAAVDQNATDSSRSDVPLPRI